MRTTIGRTPLATPYLAVPPPGGRDARPTASARHAMRRLYHRHAATLGAIATIALVVAALDWLLIPRGPDSLPLWLVLAAGVGSVAVGASVRRLERRGDAPRGRAAPSDTTGGWRDGVGIAVAAASVALLLLALVVPHGARSIVLAAGLTGVLTLRLLLPPHRIAPAVAIDRDADTPLDAASPRGARPPMTPGGAR